MQRFRKLLENFNNERPRHLSQENVAVDGKQIGAQQPKNSR
jgi:hypothetical protein